MGFSPKSPFVVRCKIVVVLPGCPPGVGVVPVDGGTDPLGGDDVETTGLGPARAVVELPVPGDGVVSPRITIFTITFEYY